MSIKISNKHAWGIRQNVNHDIKNIEKKSQNRKKNCSIKWNLLYLFINI